MTVARFLRNGVRGARCCLVYSLTRLCFDGILMWQRYYETYGAVFTALIWLLPVLSSITARSKLCAAGDVFGDEEEAVARISTQHQAVLRVETSNNSGYGKKVVEQQGGLYEGWRKSLQVSSLCMVHFHIIKDIAHNTNNDIVTVVWIALAFHRAR